MLAGWAAAGGARFHAARGCKTEWRCEVTRLNGGARSHASSPAQPAVARRAPATDQRASHAHCRSRTRAARRLCRDSPPFALPTAESHQPKSRGERVCELCEREKSKLSEIRENYPPSLCAKFQNFSTRSGPAVSAPARGRRQNRHRRANWHLSCLPPTREAP